MNLRQNNRDSASMSSPKRFRKPSKRSTTASPSSVRVAPPPPFPPFWVMTRGDGAFRFMESTSRHACRYPIPMERAAFEIEPCSLIRLSRVTRPHPKNVSPPFSIHTLPRHLNSFMSLCYYPMKPKWRFLGHVPFNCRFTLAESMAAMGTCPWDK